MQAKKQWKQFPWKYFLFLYGGGSEFFPTTSSLSIISHDPFEYCSDAENGS